MIKSGIAVTTLAAAGLFVFFFASNSDDVGNADKAKQAALDVGDAVRDKGVAGLVDLRLKTKFGFEATRFLHAYFDQGAVVVYGMAPESLDSEAIRAEAAKTPGVDAAEVLIHPRPASITPLPSLTGDKPGAPTETAPESDD